MYEPQATCTSSWSWLDKVIMSNDSPFLYGEVKFAMVELKFPHRIEIGQERQGDSPPTIQYSGGGECKCCCIEIEIAGGEKSRSLVIMA